MSAILVGTPDKRLVVVTGRAYPEQAQATAGCLGTQLLDTTAYDFANGEMYVRFTRPVRGADAFVIQAHTDPINTWIMEQLLMVDALKRASARSITVVAPFLGYSRQDKKHQGREPITARLVFDLFHAAGADRIMTVDLHASQEQGFFDGPVDHLTAMPVLLDYVRGSMSLAEATVVSPDAGRIRVSEQWAAKLGGLPLAFIHKTRDTTRPNHAEAHGIIGDVEARDCIVVDDMIDTAGTICEAVRTLHDAGAKSVTLVATHGLLSGPAIERLASCGAREIVLMDTVPVPQEKRLPNMTVLSVAPLLAAGIRSVFESGSVSTLLDGLPSDIRPRNIYA
ncbi:ribose-phosphate diphosphokinase [Bifidobacterium subtile]|jgi:ribose-phosphate pyrophosphokinase|uniref:ribose-phosphate diphosphokinase n=1 Tax=Bifidobacterium subtile TaxID=77635 RepID=A0A087E7G8_9BIFI|nr:ribose-phosphate diphosphokinase [Bifidobacterium subtile]KFJ03719.1 ribose-phosphate pyrophosphokinase [Bifidobacterium subtile]MCI1223248.1 ribose-phosphate diphosphokinase [Bifidobacterium subtile]MCI1241701.1 ribose-phosphate diphosphokinase [Bifidobacterium subtile]MCI1258487.1 ribose-phosphate diphosphokinase [Bifidobacterium subtile]QOL37695.1 ribose-phosphate diphosphokinase [Bifidobacterium subtile]